MPTIDNTVLLANLPQSLIFANTSPSGAGTGSQKISTGEQSGLVERLLSVEQAYLESQQLAQLQCEMLDQQ